MNSLPVIGMNVYRARQIKDKVLITTDSGAWLFLEQNEFELLKSKNLTPEILDKLTTARILLTTQNMSQEVDAYQRKKAFLYQGTSLHIVVVTLRCNQSCVYCHSASRPMLESKFDMTKETATKVVDFIFQSPAPSVDIEFQGGEPLANFEVIKYITEYAQELSKKGGKRVQFTMTSNLIFLDDEKLDYLICNNISVCTSLDGPRIVHEKNRGFYAPLMRQIERVNNEYRKRGMNHHINALCTITRFALAYPKEIIDEYKRLGMSEIHLRFLNELGTAQEQWEHIKYSSEEFILFWKQALDYILEINKQGTVFVERGAKIMLQKILSADDPNYAEMRSPCGAATGQIAYMYDGSVYTCDEGRMVKEGVFLIGDTRKHAYKEVLTSSPVLTLMGASNNDNFICDTCAYKPWCGICPVLNYVEQGSIIARISETSRHKIYLAQFDFLFEKLLSDPEATQIFKRWVEQSGYRVTQPILDPKEVC
ncbi:MAG: His-Xaa-Ser system radical SAM maturase HxsB [Nanoarchaeota archaeon]